jgi:TolA-binding protein
MKSRERHQLKQNDFAASMVRTSTWLRDNQRSVVAASVGAVVLVAAVAGVVLWRRHLNDQSGAMYAAAVAVSESAIAPAPTVPGAKQAPGTFSTIAERQEASLQAYQNVASSYPSSPDGIAAAYQAAGSLFALGRLQEAEKAYQDVVGRAGSSSVYGSVARLGLADTLAGEGQYDRAIKELTDLAAQRDGLLPVDGVLVQLARTYVKAGKQSDARATFKRVVDEFPNSVYVTEARQQMAALG